MKAFTECKKLSQTIVKLAIASLPFQVPFFYFIVETVPFIRNLKDMNEQQNRKIKCTFQKQDGIFRNSESSNIL